MCSIISFSDESLEERVKRNEITVKEMWSRATNLFSTKFDTLPLQVGDDFGCPVCHSKLSSNNRLVREAGYIVCDYCVHYVESYL
jgi:hypothetical protein